MPMYLRGLNVLVFVYDVTDEHYLENLEPFVDIAHDNLVDSLIVSIFCGNKIDLVDSSFKQSSITDALKTRFSDKIPHMKFVFTSALTGEGIDDIPHAIFDGKSKRFRGKGK